MARQILNLGTLPNDGTGDDARTVGSKLNAMLAELYSANTVVSNDAAAIVMAALRTLPTTLPSTPGQLWNNGGVVSIS